MSENIYQRVSEQKLVIVVFDKVAVEDW